MRKLFVIGIGGLTGSKLAEQAINSFDVYGSYNCRNPQLESVTQYQLNLLDYSNLKKILTEIKPDIIINTSGINNVDYCETNKQQALEVNVKSLEFLSKISSSLNSQLIQLSSDSVFDGKKKEPYLEDDEPNPINFYGHTKHLGEEIVLKNSSNLVVRASVLYGWLRKSLNNISSSSQKSVNFGQWLINKLKSDERVRIVTDEVSSPIIADDFARAISHLIKKKQEGIFHCAPKICIRRYDFCLKLAESLNLNSELISSITTKKLGRNVPTAENKCLDSDKISKTGFQFLSLEDSFITLKKQICF